MDLRKQLISDLGMSERIRLSDHTPLYEKIFGDPAKKPLGKWFGVRVTNIGTYDCGGGAAAACVLDGFKNKLWIAKSYVDFRAPQIARIMFIYHEARHTEDNHDGWPHVRCPTPFRDAKGRDVRGILTGTLLQGQFGCDHTPFGAYGTGVVLLRNTQLFCTNCTEKVRADAKLYAEDFAKRISEPGAAATLKKDMRR